MKFQKITEHDVSNGKGIRVVLWVSGCTVKCKGCYSPQTWNFNSGTEYTQETEDYIIKCLSKPYITGLSISGGNPTDNLLDDWLVQLVKRVKKELPHLTIYSWSGHYIEDIIDEPNVREFLSYVDMLRDGKFEEDKLNLKQHLQGSENQRYVDCKKFLEYGEYYEYDFEGE